MTASISPVPAAASSCVPFAPSREGDRKGVLLVIGCQDSRPLGLVEMKLLFELPKPWAELHDTLLPRPAQTLLPGLPSSHPHLLGPSQRAWVAQMHLTLPHIPTSS